MTLFTHFTQKKKATLYFLLSLFSITANVAYSQCPVSAKANVLSIQCGDTVSLAAIATAGDYLIKNDFNTLADQPGPGWSVTSSAMFTNPCGAAPALQAPTYLWFGNASWVPRMLVSNPFDLSTGGYISFDMRFAEEADATSGPSCEGVDLPEEGVYLQFSVGGGPWITIDYFSPFGGNDPFRTNWNNYSYTIPAAACNPGTQIRWIQTNSNGADTDHWGLDNIKIVRNDPQFLFDWYHDPAAPNTTGATPKVTPYSDTTYTVRLYNPITGVECISSVSIQTAKPTGTITATPAKLCAGGQSQLNINPSFIPPIPPCGISPTGCLGISTSANIGTGTTDDITYYTLGRSLPVGGVSACGCQSFTLNGNTTYTGNCDNSGRTQMIIQASEFPGFFKGGQIYKLAFNALALGQNKSYNNFTIQLSCTNKTEFTSNTDFVGALTTVYTPKTVVMANGWNTIEFDQAYDWDGVSNIVVQICWNTGTGVNAFRQGNMYKTATTNYSTIHSYSCGALGCTETGGSTRYQNRPSLRLGICYRPIPTLTYTWTPSASLSNATIKNPIATVPVTTEYTVVVADAKRPNCNLTKKVTVETVQPTVSINPSPAFICTNGGNVQLTATTAPATPGGSIVTYLWSPATGLSNPNIANPIASPAATTTYTLTITDNGGCTASATVTVNVTPMATPVPTDNDPVCAGSSIKLFSNVAHLPTYTYSWTGPNSFTSTTQDPEILNSTTAMTGLYKLKVTSGSCTTPEVSTNVTVNASPLSTFTVTSPVCAGANSRITYTGGAAGTAIFTWGFDGGTISSGSGIGPYDIKWATAGTKTITLTVTEAGCSSIQTSNSVIVNAIPTSSFTAPANVCQGKIASLEYTGTGGSSATYDWVFDGGVASPGGTVKGPHDVTWATSGTKNLSLKVTENNCVSAITPLTIIVKEMPTAAFSAPTAVCFGSKATISYTGTGTPAATYIWGYDGGIVNTSLGNESYEVSWSSSGNKNVSLTVDQNGCIATATPKIVIVRPEIILTTSSPVNSACGAAGGQAHVDVSGGSSGYSFLWNDALAQTTQTAVNLPAGAYQVEATNTATGCKKTAVANVQDANAPTVNEVVSAHIDVSCNSGNNGAAKADAVGGTGSLNYIWSDPAATTTNTVNGLTATTYTCTVKDAVGCKANVQITITEPPLLVANAGTDRSVCSGGSIMLNGAAYGGTGGYTYSWEDLSSPGTINGQSISVTPAATTDYRLSVMDGNTCIATDLIHITVNPLPDANFNLPSPICIDKNATITYAGAAASSAAYNWSFDNGNIISGGSGQGPHEINWISAGTKTITLEVTENSCISTKVSKQVEVKNLPTTIFNLSPGSVCENAAVTIQYTGNAATSASYTWNFDNATVQSGSGVGPYVISWPAAGNKTVSLTQINDAGCISSSSSSLPVKVNPSPISTFTASTDICITKTSTITYTGNGTASATYNWNGFDSGNIVSGFDKGPYEISWNTPGTKTIKLVVTDFGCPSIETPVNVIVIDRPKATFSVDNSNCPNMPIQITYTGNAGSSDTYTWDFDGGTAVPGTGKGPHQVKWTTDGTKDIHLSVDVNGCPSFDINTPAVVNPIPPPPSTISVSYCKDVTSKALFATPQSGGTLTWYDANGTILSAAPKPPTNNPDTLTYFVTETINGCTSPKEPSGVRIKPRDVVSLTYANGPYCETGSATAYPNQLGVKGGDYSAPSQIKINAATGIIDIQNSTPGGPYKISYISPATGCPETATYDLIINRKPITLFNFEGPYCKDEIDPLPLTDINISTNGTFSVIGLNKNDLLIDPTSGKIDLKASKVGIYTIRYIVPTFNGCQPDTTDAPIEILELPDSKFDLPQYVCIGKEALIAYSGSTKVINQYNWNFDNETTRSGKDSLYKVSWNTSGIKNVSLTLLGECFASSTKTIMVEENAKALFTTAMPISLPDTLVLPDNEPLAVEFINNSANANDYSWDFGDGSPIQNSADPTHIYDRIGLFPITLKATNNAGCPDSMSSSLFITKETILKIPTAFTPNGDNINDHFLPLKQGIKTFSLEIYNRWGEMIFYSTSKDMAWDGTFQGKPAPSGVYVYVLKGVSVLNENTYETNLVMLKR